MFAQSLETALNSCHIVLVQQILQIRWCLNDLVKAALFNGKATNAHRGALDSRLLRPMYAYNTFTFTFTLYILLLEAHQTLFFQIFIL